MISTRYVGIFSCYAIGSLDFFKLSTRCVAIFLPKHFIFYNLNILYYFSPFLSIFAFGRPAG